MLKLEDIRFPITFISENMGRIVFTNANEKGVWDGSQVIENRPLEDFIARFNRGKLASKLAPEQAAPPVQPAVAPPPTIPQSRVYRLVSNDNLLNNFAFDSFVEAINAAKRYARAHNKTVKVVVESATITVERVTQVQVTYD